MIYIFEGQGEHHGHQIVKDRWGIDFENADPKTSWFCMDCSIPLTITDAVATEPDPAPAAEKAGNDG